MQFNLLIVMSLFFKIFNNKPLGLIFVYLFIYVAIHLSIKGDGYSLTIGGDGRADGPGQSVKYGTYTAIELSIKKIVKGVGYSLTIGGDGRADSPGQSVKYGTYPAIELSIKKIVKGVGYSLTIGGDGRADSPGHSVKYRTYTAIAKHQDAMNAPNPREKMMFLLGKLSTSGVQAGPMTETKKQKQKERQHKRSTMGYHVDLQVSWKIHLKNQPRLSVRILNVVERKITPSYFLYSFKTFVSTLGFGL